MKAKYLPFCDRHGILSHDWEFFWNGGLFCSACRCDVERIKVLVCPFCEELEPAWRVGEGWLGHQECIEASFRDDPPPGQNYVLSGPPWEILTLGGLVVQRGFLSRGEAARAIVLLETGDGS